MNHSISSHTLNTPLSPGLAHSLLHFWAEVFDSPFDHILPILQAQEAAHNTDTLFIATAGQEIAATVRLTQSRLTPALGAVGEVATHPAHRSHGLALQLCTLARDTFFSHSGQALYLATINPSAARLYAKLGWAFLPGTRIMANAPSGLPFLDPRQPTTPALSILHGSPALRLPIIPLLSHMHPWLLLDANVPAFSPTHVVQGRCEGLYESYDNIPKRHRGHWLAALNPANQCIGLATLVPLTDRPGHARIDAFSLTRDPLCLSLMVDALGDHAHVKSFKTLHADIADVDIEKQHLFTPLGFVPSGSGETIITHGQHTPTTRLTRLV